MDLSRFLIKTRKDKWLIIELQTICVQEEEKLTTEKSESIFVATERKNINKSKQKGRGEIPPQGGIKK